MPRRAKPLEDTPAFDILSELHAIADTRQIIPNEHALFVHMRTTRGYTHLNIDQFRYYFSRLVKEGHLRIDQQTRAITILARRIVPAE
jgi:hypothetical protein